MDPEILDKMTIRGFRDAWGVEFDHVTLKKRINRKIQFEAGDMGALVDHTKWEGSGNAWDDEAINLFRDFYALPSPAVYLDHTGRKVDFKNFDGKDEYGFLYGINTKSNLTDLMCSNDKS